LGGSLGFRARWRSSLLLLSGLWSAPLVLLVLLLSPAPWSPAALVLSLVAFALAPVPAILSYRRSGARLQEHSKKALEESERLKIQLETIRYRTARLREDLVESNRQARLSHRLTTLGQFTAGFLHEFNNPLAILTSRIEVLLQERSEDAALCKDLEQMLKEARYMGNIAGTLLRALRRERGDEKFQPSIPTEVLQEVITSVSPLAAERGIQLALEPAEVPLVNIPAHVVAEVARALISNAIEALGSREDSRIWVRIDPYQAAGAKVVVRFEDNGPGVPEKLREHLFEPFVSSSTGRERLGLGLFLSASLLDTYDGALQYEPRAGGGATFSVHMPAARFTSAQPYHWLVKGVSQ
jgi:two-component system C4-dicarboxylate transport sensor histidine kinase DctB